MDNLRKELDDFERDIEYNKTITEQNKKEFISFLTEKTQDEWIEDIKEKRKKKESFWTRFINFLTKRGR